jgi:hypothetical protein
MNAHDTRLGYPWAACLRNTQKARQIRAARVTRAQARTYSFGRPFISIINWNGLTSNDTHNEPAYIIEVDI